MSNHRIKTELTLVVAAAMMVAWSGSDPVAAAPSSRARTVHAVNSAASANSILRREVFGFVNAYNLGDASVGYPSWDFRLLSTVAFFGLHVNSGNGYIVPGDTAWNIYHSSTMSNFVSMAHANGVRVIVSINLHGTLEVCDGLRAAHAQNTITETIQLMQWAGIDGININYEAENVTCYYEGTSRDLMTAFVKNLRAAMPAGSYLAIDTYSGSAEDNLEFFNVTGIAPYVDAMFVMAYDMDYANSTEAPILCSAYCFNPISPVKTYRFNVTKSAQQYTALVPANKVIMGQPYYGRRGCVTRGDVALQYPTRDLVTPTYLFASTIQSQTGVSNFAAHRDGGDGVSEWDTWYDTDWNCIREQYFDDVVSLGAKYDVVNAYNLRGVGLFTLDYGGGAPELWNLLNVKFATKTPWFSRTGRGVSGPGASSWGASRTDVFVRGGDNAIWHRSFDGTSWSDWESLGGVITSDPTAVSWGPNRIDLFVRGGDYALWHRIFDGTAWSGWQRLGGVLTSSPEVASWGANHLDVFVRGADNALWKQTWDGTSWTWSWLGGVITSDPGAVSSASNRIDVFVRGSDSALWRDSWNGTSWSWSSLGGVLPTAPDAASCAAGHLDVFVLGMDSAVWQRSYDGTVWGDWQRLGGQWTSAPGAVCSPGTTSINLFERGVDTALWHTTMPGT